MPEHIQTLTVPGAAGTSTTVTHRIEKVPTGREWVIPQISVEISQNGIFPTQVVYCNIRRNGRLIASTNSGQRANASGQPYYLLQPGELITIEWTNAPAQYQSLSVAYYTEYPAGFARLHPGII